MKETNGGATTVEDKETTEILTPNVVESLTRGEIDIQVATAKRFPRSLVAFKARALEMATLDQQTAESCIYALPRDGKTIEGPSARLAEILASAYGHMRVEGRPIGDDGHFITARGTAWDIQNNVLIAFETKRRITGKNGRRFSDDMIGVTANAATSIAIRNSVLKVIPKAFWGPVYEACRKTAVGDARTLVNQRAAMLEYFLKMGVPNERVFALIDVKGVEDITLDHMATLKGLATAIKEGDTTVDEAFAVEPKEVKRASETPQPAKPVATPEEPAADVVVLDPQTIKNVEQFLGGFTITLGNGLTVDCTEAADAMALESFKGTPHKVRLTCKKREGALELVSFKNAD